MKKKRLRHISLLLFFTLIINLSLPCLSVRGETISRPGSLAGEHSLTELDPFHDIAGHWAEKEIKAWTVRELAGGYSDGSFRPDSSITRAEFVPLVNRAFGYTKMANTPAAYLDVAATDWFAGEIANAAAVGYLSGYPDGTVKPQNPITRQEAAAVFARILPINNGVQVYHNGNIDNINNNENLDNTDNNPNRTGVDSAQDTLAQFIDQVQIPEWSKAAIVAAVNGGYMSGYPDGTFQPTKAITRAEALSVLDRAVGTLYNRAGTYGPFQGTVVIEGNVTISTAGVTLQNTTVTGNLYLTEGIGEGDVTLNHVIVQGTTKIAGGGRNSIHLLNTSLGAVLVNVPGRQLVRLSAKGNTDVGPLEARTPAILEEEELSAAGFTKVVIKPQESSSLQGTKPAIIIELAGEFSDVEIQEATVQLNLQKGSIANLSLSSSAQSAQINLAAETTVQTLFADTAATIQGQGTVETTQANVDGVVIAAQAKNVLVADGVQATVEGKTITEEYKYTEPKKKKSKDAALSDLMINGTTVGGFVADRSSYDFVLPYGSTKDDLPLVTAEARHAKAKVVVTQATDITEPDNIATVVVRAENGRTQTYTVCFTVGESSAKAITAFHLFAESEPEPEPVGIGVIDEEANPKTINVTVPYGTDVTSLVPTIEHTGVSISPASGTPRDFTDSIANPVTYTVTAADGSTAEYEVTVTIASNSEASLTSLAVNPGTIAFAPGTYFYDNVVVPYGTASVEVTFAATAGATTDLDSPYTVAITDKAGTFSVEVTAEDGISKQTYTINFVEAVPVTGVSLDKETTTLAVGENETLTVTVSPEDASNQTVDWASSDTNVATVDGTGKVTAVGVGTATITVTTVDGNKTDSCGVTVNPAPIGDFACSTNDGTSATFTWTAAAGATGIKIKQSTYNSVDETWSEWTEAYTAPIEPTATSAKVVGLTAGATYKFKLVVTGGNNAGDSNEVDVTTSTEDANAYGARWPAVGEENNNLTTMTRLGAAAGKTAGANFNGFSPWSGMQRENIDGQVMVKIPKFYYKHTCSEVDIGDGKKRMVHEFWVSDGPAEGFKLHPAFIRAGVEKEYVLMGAYKAGEIVDDGKTKLTSVSGAIPAVSRNINTFRTQAQNRGTGWEIVDALTRNAVALLYLVEYADTNSQATIGQGITGLRYSADDKVTVASTEPGNTIIVSSATGNFFEVGRVVGVGTTLGGGQVCQHRTITKIEPEKTPGGEETGNVIITVDGNPFSTTMGNIIYHVGQKTGGCDGLGNASGSADGSKGNKVSVSYRRIEDLWGNVWEFVDGINIKNRFADNIDEIERQPYVADHGFASNVFSEPYQPSGITLPLGNGYVKDFACSAAADWLLMPSASGETGTGSSTYIPDYFYQNWDGSTSDRVALVGGRWADGSNAGLFFWRVDAGSSDARLTVGARLLLIP